MIHFLTYSPNGELCAFQPINTPFCPAKVERWLRAVAAGYNYTIGELTYIFCNDEKILDVNRQFLGHDYYTDVITFDYTVLGTLSGDIYISTDTVESNAAAEHTRYEEELLRIIVHGALHLTGQADKTPETKSEMTRKENLALDKFNLL